jgi:hypothetical protein
VKDERSQVAVQSIVPIVGNNTTEGTGVGVDLAGFESAKMLAHIGDSGDTLSGSVYMTVGFQESDTLGSGYADIAADDLKGGANNVVIDAPAEDQVVVQRNYVGGKRYVRILVTFTGTHTNGTPISAVVIKGHARHAPAPDQATGLYTP